MNYQPSESPEAEPYNLNNELARERTRAASDRTLMAWIRTALSLISFGFGLPTIVRAIESTRLGARINPHHFSTTVGLLFIAIGMYAMAAALKEHHRTVKRIQSNHFMYESSNTTEKVGVALMAVGFISFVGLIIRSLVL